MLTATNLKATWLRPATENSTGRPPQDTYLSCNVFGCGTVFRITPMGLLTTLHSFVGLDGSARQAALIQASKSVLHEMGARALGHAALLQSQR